MKTWLLGITGLLFTLTCANAEVSVFGSYWDPDDTDEAYGAGLELNTGGELFSLNVRGTYFEDLTDDGPLFDSDLQAIPVDVGLQLDIVPVEAVSLYGGAGGSWYFLDSDDFDIDDEFGWYFEGGAELSITERVAVFAEAVWRSVEGTAEDDDLDDLDSDRVDIDLDGVTVNVGLVFR